VLAHCYAEESNDLTKGLVISSKLGLSDKTPGLQSVQTTGQLHVINWNLFCQGP